MSPGHTRYMSFAAQADDSDDGGDAALQADDAAAGVFTPGFTPAHVREARAEQGWEEPGLRAGVCNGAFWA